MKRYEAICIFYPDLAPEKIDSVISKVEGKITGSGGEVKKIDRWGMKKLSYAPRKGKGVKEGYYVAVYFSGPGATPNEVNGLLSVTEGLIRHMVAVSQVMPAAEKPETKEEDKVEIASSMLESPQK